LSKFNFNSFNFCLWTKENIRFSLYVHLFLFNSYIFNSMFISKRLRLLLNISNLLSNNLNMILLLFILLCKWIIIHNLSISCNLMLFDSIYYYFELTLQLQWFIIFLCAFQIKIMQLILTNLINFLLSCYFSCYLIILQCSTYFKNMIIKIQIDLWLTIDELIL